MNDTGSVARAAPVPFRVTLASILGVWLCYFLLVTLRSAIVDNAGGFAHFARMLGPRALVALSGVAATFALWFVLRRFDARSLAWRIAAIILLALPAALAMAYVNKIAFAAVDTSDSVFDDGRTRVDVNARGDLVVDMPGRPPLKVRNPHGDDTVALWKELSDIAIGRYFLLLAWGALYLALGNAERVRAAERRAASFEQAARAAELRSLRYQVNPHFLFNTLNSLSALVMTGRTAEAEAMIQTLSTFYRTSLTGDPTADVKLDEEVALQRLYLAIEAIRFPCRLHTRFEIPEGLQSACVPGLILQPLVENAVKHGVAPLSRPVTIVISAKTVGAMLQIIVADDGAGDENHVDGIGIGLANVRDRLFARFGSTATVEATRINPGYAVRLMLPVVRDGC